MDLTGLPRPTLRPRFTLVVFHAHPDDEALLTSGTMARASAEGHRVVLVVATDGGVGLVASDFLAGGEDLAARRKAELHRSATAIGCARVPPVARNQPFVTESPCHFAISGAVLVSNWLSVLAVKLLRHHWLLLLSAD